MQSKFGSSRRTGPAVFQQVVSDPRHGERGVRTESHVEKTSANGLSGNDSSHDAVKDQRQSCLKVSGLSK